VLLLGVLLLHLLHQPSALLVLLVQEHRQLLLREAWRH
jgi:hypothetical protein